MHITFKNALLGFLLGIAGIGLVACGNKEASAPAATDAADFFSSNILIASLIDVPLDILNLYWLKKSRGPRGRNRVTEQEL